MEDLVFEDRKRRPAAGGEEAADDGYGGGEAQNVVVPVLRAAGRSRAGGRGKKARKAARAVEEEEEEGVEDAAMSAESEDEVFDEEEESGEESDAEMGGAASEEETLELDFLGDVFPEVDAVPDTFTIDKRNYYVPEEEDVGLAPAWEDPDDREVRVALGGKRTRKLCTLEEKAQQDVEVDGVEYQRRLRQLAMKATAGQNVEWADLRKAEERRAAQDAETQALVDALTTSTDAKVEGRAGKGILRPNIIRVQPLRDVNFTAKNSTTVSALGFHPKRPEIAMVASFDRTLSLFQMDGKDNPRIAGAKLGDLPIAHAAFLGDGEEILCCGPRSFLYLYDVNTSDATRIATISGRTENNYPHFAVSPDSRFIVLHGSSGGEAIVLDGRTKQLIGTVTMPMGTFAHACFDYSSDNNIFYGSGSAGHIASFDLRQMRCVNSVYDDGCIHSTSLAISPDNRFLAAGSDSGVCNFYSYEEFRNTTGARAPKPLRAVTNLTTSVDHIAFTHDGQAAAIASHAKRDALRLVHTGSMTVFGNWPQQNTPLRRVSSLAFSPNSGILAIGNDNGHALAYRMVFWRSI